MNFLIDAQLPRRLIFLLREAGHDAVHTLDLPHRNRTTDQEIIEISAREQRAVITKDADFVDSFVVRREPYKRLLVSTGNVPNLELEELFKTYLPTISMELATHDYIELSRSALIVHG